MPLIDIRHVASRTGAVPQRAASVTARRSSTSRRSAVVARADASGSVGSKVEKWLKTPFDIAAFGPRAGLGALLSVPERLQTLRTDVEKVAELLQDPRPLEEKQAVVLREIEDTLVECLERGATVEADVLANVKANLPPEVASIVTDLVPEPPTASSSYAPPPPTYGGAAGDSAPQYAYTAESVHDTQVVGEVVELQAAVSRVKGDLAAIAANTDPSRRSMMKLNLREARDLLARRVDEIAPDAASGDASMSAALQEARVLLEEVGAVMATL